MTIVFSLLCVDTSAITGYFLVFLIANIDNTTKLTGLDWRKWHMIGDHEMHLFADAIGCWLLFVSFVFVGSFSVNSILLLLYLPSFSYSSCLRLLGRLCFLPCFMSSLAPCAFQLDMLGIIFLLSLFIASFYILLSLFIQTIISPRCLSTYLLHSFSYWHSSQVVVYQ